jgi:hypothetical protein
MERRKSLKEGNEMRSFINVSGLYPGHMNPVHILTQDFLKINTRNNIILPSTSRFSEWSLFFRHSA